jgi:hypothetical protein
MMLLAAIASFAFVFAAFFFATRHSPVDVRPSRVLYFRSANPDYTAEIRRGFQARSTL